MSITMIENKKLKRIHVNKHTLRKNNKEGRNDPAIGIEVSGEPKHYVHTVEIWGPSRVVQRQHKPLSCGAKCWVETRASLTFGEEEE